MLTATVTILALATCLASAAAACDLPGTPDTRLAWQTPVTDGATVLGSPYGQHHHPILGYEALHLGQDWLAAIGTTVRAAAAGRVVEAQRSGAYGNVIRIEHGGGWETRYAHLQGFEPAIATGTCISAGQAIGRVGNTGLAVSPHLHFELLRNARAIDPMGP